MDHLFQTRRDDLKTAQESRVLADDIVTLYTRLTKADRICIHERRDVDIANAQVRDAVVRHAADLGKLATKLVEVGGAMGQPVADGDKVVAAWRSFLETPNADTRIVDAAEAVRACSAARVAEIVATEVDDGSSSYSDYSDKTRSTDSTSGGDSEGGDSEGGDSDNGDSDNGDSDNGDSDNGDSDNGDSDNGDSDGESPKRRRR